MFKRQNYVIIFILRNFTRWGRLWDHPHEQHFACSPPVSRLITFPPTSWWFLPWRQVRPEKSEATRAIPWYQDRAGYAPLRSRFCCWWARWWRFIAIISLHCLFEIGTLSQNRYWFWQRKLAQRLYLDVSPFCTRSRGLVLKPQSLPYRVNLNAKCNQLYRVAVHTLFESPYWLSHAYFSKVWEENS